MAQSVKKKSAFKKYMRKHVFISLFGLTQALALVAFAVEFILFKTWGYYRVTKYYPSPNEPLSLHFWQKCGIYGPSHDIPLPNLFCANDTHTLFNPIMRSVLFGTELYSIIGSIIIGVMLLVVCMTAIKYQGQKTIWKDAPNLMSLVLQLTFFIAILTVIYQLN